jgi:molecular chaperone DnaJ
VGSHAKACTGDLLAKVQVIVPQRLTDEAREAVERLRDQEAGVDPRAELFAKAPTEARKVTPMLGDQHVE